MSNKYFRNWQASNSLETSHLGILKKLDDDCTRLDRTLDKIDNKKKANQIFKQAQQIHQAPIYSGIGFVNQGFAHPQVVHLTHIGDKYVMVNGCLVLCREQH